MTLHSIGNKVTHFIQQLYDYCLKIIIIGLFATK